MGATGGGRRADGAPIFPPHGHCGGADPGHGNKIEVGSCACLLAPDGFVVGDIRVPNVVINGHLDAFGMGSEGTVYSRALSYRESPLMVESDYTWLDKKF